MVKPRQKDEKDEDFKERMSKYDGLFWEEAIAHGECMVMLRFPVNPHNLEYTRNLCANVIDALLTLGFSPGLTVNKGQVNRYPDDDEFVFSMVEIKTFEESKQETGRAPVTSDEDDVMVATVYHY
jgi:hypothetical protein